MNESYPNAVSGGTAGAEPGPYDDEHPLGDVNGTGRAAVKSIVDTILDLDDLLSSDVRLAEKSARFCIRPDLEARMEELHDELDGLTDSQGRPMAPVDASMADGARSARSVALEIQELQAEYTAAMRTVRVRAMDEDDWTAFMTRHKAALMEAPPYPAAVYEDLIARSAIAPTFTAETVQAFRKKAGHPAFTEIAGAAWAVNTSSGVSIPKSSLSSGVLRHIEQG